MTRPKKNQVPKIKVEAPEELALMKQESAAALTADAASPLPWWMPENLDERAAMLAEDMINGLDDKTYFALKHSEIYKTKPGKLKEMVSQVILSMMNSAEYRHELAKWALLKPLEILKIQASLVPKNVTMDAVHKHSHVIVVPGITDPKIWNDAHVAQQEISEGDWGMTLEGTPFAQFAPDDSLEN